MSPVLIIVLVVVAWWSSSTCWVSVPTPTRGRRPTPGILRRRSKWRKVLPIVPLVAAVGCLVLAFTGFGFNFTETSPTIVLVMDVSDSMDATDVAPNRLAAAEAAANAFLEELPPDFRIGLATFAGDAELAVPPTQESDEVVQALASLTTSRGTVIGDGLSVALDAIEEIGCDGRRRRPRRCCSPTARTPEAWSHRIRRRNGREHSRCRCSRSWSGRWQRGTRNAGADLEALESIARRAAGETFTAETADELTTIYENLGSELSVDLDVEPSTRPLVIAAIALTVLAGLMLVLMPR